MTDAVTIRMLRDDVVPFTFAHSSATYDFVSHGGEPFELFQISFLRDRYWPWRNIVVLKRLRQMGRRTKETFCLFEAKARQLCGLEIGRRAVRGLDQCDNFARQLTREAEADVDRSQQSLLDGLVRMANYGLEGRNYIADDIFGSVVQEQREAKPAVDVADAMARNRLDKQCVLCDGKNMLADGLAVPSGDARKPMRNILDFDVERGGIKEIQTTSR
jgi:hypothetical protein